MDGLTDELKLQSYLLVTDHTNNVTKRSVGEVWFGFQFRNVDEISHANEGCL
jgi:hypothetical protein